MPILGKTLAHQYSTDKGAKTIMQRLGIQRTGDSSSNHDQSGSRSAGKPGAVQNNNGINPNNNLVNLMVASSVLESTYPSVMKSSSIRHGSNLVSYDKNGEIRHDKHNGSSVFSEGTLLEELMDPHHVHHDEFVKFVESRYAGNEIALFGSTVAYKNAADNKERAKLGKFIVKEFIADNAPRAVDIPYQAKEILLSAAKRSQWVSTTFDQVRTVLMFDLKGNFLSKFEQMMMNLPHINKTPRESAL